MRRKLPADRIIDIVCEYYDISRKKMLSTVRRRQYVVPRQVCIYMLRYNSQMSLLAIAKAMTGDKDKPQHHSTLIYSIKTVFALLESDDSFEHDIEAITQNIKEEMKINIVTRKDVIKSHEPPPVVRMDILSPADEVRRKYL